MWWSLLACDLDLVDRGPREAPDEVTWAGWVYAGPPETDAPTVFSGGSLVFSPEGADPVEAEEPYEDYPGYWVATVPAGAPVTLRIAGEGTYPTVWAGDTPTGNGSWGNGYLFSADVVYMDALWALLPPEAGAAPPGEGTVNVWGVAASPDWDCAAATVGEGAPYCVAVAEDGSLTRVDAGPYDYFFAFGLPAGDVLVDGGAGAAETYSTEGGDVVMALWFQEGA